MGLFKVDYMGNGDGTAHGQIPQTTARQEIEIDTGLTTINRFVIVGEHLGLGYDRVITTIYSSKTPTKYYWMNGGIYGGNGGQTDYPTTTAQQYYYAIKSINGGKITIIVPFCTSPNYAEMSPYWYAE